MKNVHEYSVDRATNSARLGATNPIRKYINGDDPPVAVQLAHGELHFYDQGEQPVRIEDVPQYILDNLKASPLRRGNESPEQVLKFCPFCSEDNNAVASGQYEKHLEEHIRQKAVSAREVSAAPQEFAADVGEVVRHASHKAAKKGEKDSPARKRDVKSRR